MIICMSVVFFIGEEKVESVEQCASKNRSLQVIVGSEPFHLCLEEFRLHMIICFTKNSRSGEPVENFLCGLFASQLLLLAFVTEYIKIAVFHSPRSMSALRQAL